jgi:hypothetical protein
MRKPSLLIIGSIISLSALISGEPAFARIAPNAAEQITLNNDDQTQSEAIIKEMIQRGYVVEDMATGKLKLNSAVQKALKDYRLISDKQEAAQKSPVGGCGSGGCN